MQLFPALPEVVRGMFRRPEALAVCPPGGELRERGMFLNQTANYGLSQWEATDRILMENFNSDNAKLDAALAAHDGDIAALEAAVAGKGNCQFSYGTYTGSGTYGTGHPTKLTFPFEPKLVIIQNMAAAATDTSGSSQYGRYIMFLVRPLTSYYFNSGSFSASITWSGKTVSWASTDGAAYQLNVSGNTYLYVALG